MKDHRVDGVRRRLGFSKGFHVSPIGRAGGLSMWWDESVDVEVGFSSKYSIDARFKLVDSEGWTRVTWVYGTSYRAEKEAFWGWMHTWFKPSNIPWLCGGDFNEILWDYEKSGGADLNYNRPWFLEEFLNSSELMDMEFKGPPFTWRGMRNGQLVEERLDRVLSNKLWQECWPNSLVIHEPVIGSDHCPLIIQSQPHGHKPKKVFRFEAFWAKEEKCKEIVESCWRRQYSGDGIARWQKKMHQCRSQLSCWSRNAFKSRGIELDCLLNQLGDLQYNWNQNFEQIQELTVSIGRLWEIEESYWLQRSRVKWLQEGDANTAFFHQSTLQRRRRNCVVKLQDGRQGWVENQDSIRHTFEDHYINLFTSSGLRDWGQSLHCIQHMVSDQMNEELTRPVGVEEIKLAAFQMGGLKAPGPNGFQGIFYQTFWNTLLDDVNCIVQDYMQGACSPKRLNSTYIVLVPKVKNPVSVGQFRPISLCNYSYKIVSKVLANRLKPILPDLISPMQSAFVSGRQIQDNIGIAHEMFHFLHLRKAKYKFEMGIKLDMHKAYDRVEWDFLEAVMERMGFCSLWRNLVMGCVKTVDFAVILNGQPGRKFTPSRGIRQGDPLSPYLFILVNVQKSCMFFGANVPNSLSAELCTVMGMPSAENPGLYLGLPSSWGRSKKQSLAFVKGRILEKIQDWKQNTLSQAGKEVMIKAVLQAIPAYPMNFFKFPATLCSEMDSLIAAFWWGQKGGEKRIHWVSKDLLGLPKQAGGMGFRGFKEFNDALLAKQCWRLIQDPDSLWAKILKARYFPNGSFLDAIRGGRASWGWSSLLVGREVLLQGAHWQIMNGRTTRVWMDMWIPSIPEGHPLPISAVPVSRNLRVGTLISDSSGTWDLDFLQPFISPEDFSAILDTCIGDPLLEDRLVWPGTRNGIYTVKSGYHWKKACSMPFTGRGTSSSYLIHSKVWKAIWKLATPPKIRNFMWRALHRALATMDVLFIRRCSPSPLCPICHAQEESVEHLFFLCPWVEPIWFGGSLSYRVNRESFSSLAAWLASFFEAQLGSKDEIMRLLSYAAFTCWHIWKARCALIFNQKKPSPQQLILAISNSVGSFLEASCAPMGLVRSSPPVSPSLDRWSPPYAPFWKVNVDASWTMLSKRGFAGVVIRDHEGCFVAARRMEILAANAEAAEAYAILCGCEVAVSLGLPQVILESDSKENISILEKATSSGSWEAFPIRAKIRRIAESFQCCRWSWVKRSANMTAHCLASRRNTEMCGLTWINTPPSSLVHVLNKDGLPCPP
ncbi:hypothetical protein ACFX1Q_015702 [Malus domestica]